MKAYIKPELFYERYEVSQHIADCAWEFNHYEKNSCFATADPKWFGQTVYPTLFLEERIGCEFTDAVEYENYCYQNNEDGVKLHMS